CLLRRGVERWPQSARLHALLAEAAAGATCSDIGFIAPEDGLPLTHSAALRALALDPACGEAHMFASLAESRFVDASAAVAAARRALALSPGNANLHHWGAAILLC